MGTGFPLEGMKYFATRWRCWLYNTDKLNADDYSLLKFYVNFMLMSTSRKMKGKNNKKQKKE